MPAHRHPFRGEPVSVLLVHGGIMRARARGLYVRHLADEDPNPPRLRVTPTKSKQRGRTRTDVALDDEGRTWCRGWNGPQVNALRTVGALQPPPETWEMKP